MMRIRVTNLEYETAVLGEPWLIRLAQEEDDVIYMVVKIKGKKMLDDKAYLLCGGYHVQDPEPVFTRFRV